MSGSGAASAAPTNFNTYNHFNQSSSQLVNGSTFVDEKKSSNTLKVVDNSDGTQSLMLTINGESVELKSGNARTDTFKKTESFTTTRTTYSGPNGTAEVIQGENGRYVVSVNYKGVEYIFTPNNTFYSPDEISNTQYYGSTGYNVQQFDGAYGGSATQVTGPYGGTASQVTGPYGGTARQVNGPYGGTATAVTDPYGNSSFSAEGPYGGEISGTNADYSSSLPPGIPASMIPPGQEDLYILKSQVVPPVCPVCPTPSFREREKPCPPCPPCARCPEPSFECKKVPNYNNINSDELPIAVLNDFSSFGM
jgi:hypothetical protein